VDVCPARDKAQRFAGENQPNFRIRAMTWDQLLHNRFQQLKFVQDALAVTTNEGTGLAELRRIHGEHLPDLDAREPDSGEAQAAHGRD